MFKILGTDDSVNTCDCCGKSNLKYTVTVEVDGELMHYGSVCATRHTKLTDKEIKHVIKSQEDGRRAAAKKEYNNSPEHIALQIRMNQAHAAKVPTGKEFKMFISEALNADKETLVKIAKKFNIEPHQIA